MDTWEVVIILVLLTIAITVIAKQEVPLSFISLLDNTYLQLAILGLTLGIAVISPPVAIVAIATIVIVYYVRNLVKIQIAQLKRRMEQEYEQELQRRREHELHIREQQKKESKHDEPRIEIREEIKTIKTTEIIADKETLDAALKEHESRQPSNAQADIGTRSSIGGVPAMSNNKPAAHSEILDPRGPHRDVESFDTHGSFHSEAPTGTERQPLASIASDVFTSSRSVDGYNESTAAVQTIRSYNDNSGQYDLHESRPEASVERYDVVDYLPMKDMGANNFEPVGVSIDDKINLLKRGILPSSAPPPDFNTVVPGKAH